MALFGSGESKEDKKERKTIEFLSRYGLEDLSDPRDIKAVKEIANALFGNKLTEAATALQGNTIDTAKISYFRALMAQNFIIIRQLDRLNRNLEK